MNKPMNYLNIIICSLLILSSCENKNSNDSKFVNQNNDSVNAFLLKRETVNKTIAIPGELIPLDRAEIFAKVTGYISAVKVDIGDKVQKGQVLATLDAPEIVSNYAQANADMQAAKAKYAGSLDAYKRIVNASKVEGTIAIGELEKAKSQMQNDSASVESAKAKFNSFAQLKEYLIIHAPFNGVITQRNIDPGTLTGVGNAKPILVIENNNELRLRLPVPEMYISSSINDMNIHFSVDAYPGILFEGKISRKSEAINLANRTEVWEFLCDNKDNKLKSGMFANCIIKFKRPAPSFVIPVSAIVTNQERKFVIKLTKGKSEWIDVKNGFSLNDSTEVFGNLNEKDTIVAKGNDEMKQGKGLLIKNLKQ